MVMEDVASKVEVYDFQIQLLPLSKVLANL